MAAPVWVQVADLPGTPPERSRHAGATDAQGRIYVMGGRYGTSDGRTSSASRFDPASGTWESLPSIPNQALEWAAAAVDDAGRVYYLGGSAGTSGARDYASRFDPATGLWESLPPVPIALYGAVAEKDTQGRILLIGGYPPSTASATVYRFDPATNTWDTAAPLPTPRIRAGSGVDAQGRIYVVGGYYYDGGAVYPKEVYRYTTDSDSWETVAGLPYGVEYPVVASAGGDLYLIGGNYEYLPGSFEVRGFQYRYSVVTDTWEDLGTSMATRRRGATTGTDAQGRIYLMGGYSGTGDTTATATAYQGVVNAAPHAPTLTAPISAEVIDRDVTQRFTWAFSDPDGGDTQSAYSLRHRPVGVTAWTDTGWVASPTSYHEFPAGTLTLGDYEWQVAVKDSQGVAGPFSVTGFFTAGDSPPSPSILSPVNNGTVSTETATVTWSTPDQDAYQVQVLDESDTVLFDSGTVNSTAARSAILSFEDNLVTRKVRVRVRDGGLWSQWSTVTVNVSYITPSKPTAIVNVQGFSLLIEPQLKAPIEDQPAVVSYDVYLREQDATEEIRVATGIAAGSPWVWHTPRHGVTYEARLRVYGDNGTSAWSDWFQADGTVDIHGVLLHDPANPQGTLHQFRLNDTGVTSDDLKVEHEIIQYAGREFPVVEFGESTSRTIDVGVIHSEMNSGDAEALRALVLRRAILCYRDRRGRKVFGVIPTNSLSDKRYGQKTSIEMIETDYTEEV